jgi:plasmid stability protein
MAQLLVRNIEDEMKKLLKMRAKKHGRSMEAEARDILRAALTKKPQEQQGFGTRFASHFKGIGLKEPIPELRGEVWARPVDFSGAEFEPKPKKRKR